jgi:hypothetical protein
MATHDRVATALKTVRPRVWGTLYLSCPPAWFRVPGVRGNHACTTLPFPPLDISPPPPPTPITTILSTTTRPHTYALLHCNAQLRALPNAAN